MGGMPAAPGVMGGGKGTFEVESIDVFGTALRTSQVVQMYRALAVV